MTRWNKAFQEQEIRLTVLGEGGWSIMGRLTGVMDSIARVDSSREIPAGAKVRIDSGDALLLGECRGCLATASHFEIRIVLQQVIPSVTDLANLVAAICEASPGHTRPETKTVVVPVSITR